MTGELDKLSVRQEVADFLREMKYDEPRAALFLLGTLVGGIGTEQFNAGAKSKPILNKLNFHAMGVPKLRRLYSDVFERMHQLKLLTAENEKTYAVSMEMFGKSSEQWPLTAEESVFYVVSGYAFSTYKAITSRKPELAQQAPEEVRNQSEGLDEQAEGN